jgi:hypothetical protein
MRASQRIFQLLISAALACSDESAPEGEAGGALAPGGAVARDPSDTSLRFFVTSAGSGELGGNLGGLEGADARCQQHAAAAGAGSKVWSAYLSTATVDARDRIGPGPWHNAAGEQVAAGVDALHTDGLKNGDPQHMLDELGNLVPEIEHDILTGSDAEGRLFRMEDGRANTCGDWTLSVSSIGPRVGHSDIPAPQFSPSWNSAHTAPGCDQRSFNRAGGAGRLYCFAE